MKACWGMRWNREGVEKAALQEEMIKRSIAWRAASTAASCQEMSIAWRAASTAAFCQEIIH